MKNCAQCGGNGWELWKWIKKNLQELICTHPGKSFKSLRAAFILHYLKLNIQRLCECKLQNPLWSERSAHSNVFLNAFTKIEFTLENEVDVEVNEFTAPFFRRFPSTFPRIFSRVRSERASARVVKVDGKREMHFGLICCWSTWSERKECLN